jgi:nicotinate-nucleotide adenylyltransferase
LGLRLGIYGGAFDPPHNAHVALARAAVEQLSLDELRVFPTGHAWHRSGHITEGTHRLAMTKLAFEGLPKALVDDREMRRAGPTYTIDTVRELRRELHEPELFLVMGEDQARAFTNWHEWAEIARVVTLCVARRGAWADQLQVAGAKVVVLQLPSMPESATEIRELVPRGEDISLLVPAAVARYIASHHLYRSH